MVAGGGLQIPDDVRGKDRKAEEDAGGERCGDKIVAVERQGGGVAGEEAGETVWVHAASEPDKEVAEDEEARGGCADGGDDAQGGDPAQKAAAEQADDTVPDPGDEVGTHMEGVKIDAGGQVDVGEGHDGDGGDGLPAGAA